MKGPFENVVDLSEQVENLVKACAESQTKMWESWCGLFRGVPVQGMPFPDVSTQWREIAMQGLKAWTTESKQEVKDAAEGLLSPHAVFMRFFELALTAWKSFPPQGGQDGQTMLTQYTGQLREHLLQFPERAVRSLEDTSKLWQLYMGKWQKIGQPWLESGRRASWRVGEAATGDGSALIELTNLYWDTYERTFGWLLESPSLGHTRELNEQLLKGFNAWIDLRRASLEYQFICADVWTKAFERFMLKLISRKPPYDKVLDLRELLDLWIDTVDEAFLEMFRTDEYVRTQARLMNTAMAYRTHERAITEAFLKISHVPSRSELDETHHRIYELRKEMKQLKKALQMFQEERLSRHTGEQAFPHP